MSKHISCGGCYFLRLDDNEEFECFITTPKLNRHFSVCEFWIPKTCDDKAIQYMRGLAIAKQLRKRLGISEREQ